MHVYITGAAGFLGSHLCDRFLAEGHRVTGVDDFSTGNRANIAHLSTHERFRFIEHDVTEYLSVNGPIDGVLHFASPASPVDYLTLPIHTLKVGSLGTHRTLEFAKEKGARYLLASTSEVYGDPKEHPQHEHYWGNVNPVGPRGVYDEAKRFAEAMTMAYHRYHGLSVRIARIFNTYGPRMRPSDGRVVSNFIVQALRDAPLTIYGSGLQTRSFCYVDDEVEGLYKLFMSDEVGPMNIGNPSEFTVIELAELVRETCGRPVLVEHRALPTDDPSVRRPDIELARARLGWEPKVELREGLQKTTAYFRRVLDASETVSDADEGPAPSTNAAGPTRSPRSTARRRVGFLVAPDEAGHRAPMLALADKLRSSGVEVLFLGVADDEARIRQYGHPYVVLAEKSCPKGTFVASTFEDVRRIRLGPPLKPRAFGEIVQAIPRLRALDLDLLLVDGVLPAAALVALALPTRCAMFNITLHPWNIAAPPLWTSYKVKPNGELPLGARLAWLQHRYNFTPAGLLTTMIQKLIGEGPGHLIQKMLPNSSLQRLEDVVGALPNLVACPRSFEYPVEDSGEVHYLGTLVDRRRPDTAKFDWGRTPSDAAVVYLSMGTNAYLMRQPLKFFGSLFKMIATRRKCHLIVSTSAHIDLRDLMPWPDNVEVHRTLPQLEVLQRADLMITHAGINSVKECVAHGVPMLAFPIDRDQPGNAARIEYHGLGLQADYRTTDPHRLGRMLDRVLTGPQYKEGVERMRRLFLEAEARTDAVGIIEELAARPMDTWNDALAGTRPRRAPESNIHG